MADTWDMQAVFRRLAKRGTDGEPDVQVEDVLLAYARWQGKTDEANVDAGHAKAVLDGLLDRIEPDAWNGLKELIGEDVSEDLVVGTMRYAQQRGLNQTQSLHKEVQQMSAWPVGRTDDESPSPTRPRRRSR